MVRDLADDQIGSSGRYIVSGFRYSASDGGMHGNQRKMRAAHSGASVVSAHLSKMEMIKYVRSVNHGGAVRTW